MDKLLIDTSVIVRYFKSNDGILAEVMSDYKLVISVISMLELFASNRGNNPIALEKMKSFLEQNFEIVPVSTSIATQAASIIRDIEQISFAHSVVAASAIVNDIPLVTYDIKTFDSIPDLKIVDL